MLRDKVPGKDYIGILQQRLHKDNVDIYAKRMERRVGSLKMFRGCSRVSIRSIQPFSFEHD